jgi:predicted transcriptional regulator
MRNYYKKYCKILTRVINEAKKKQCYKKIVEDSTNKIKTAWQLVKENTSDHSGNEF